jgi:hypothetical protein
MAAGSPNSPRSGRHLGHSACGVGGRVIELLRDKIGQWTAGNVEVLSKFAV